MRQPQPPPSSCGAGAGVAESAGSVAPLSSGSVVPVSSAAAPVSSAGAAVSLTFVSALVSTPLSTSVSVGASAASVAASVPASAPASIGPASQSEIATCEQLFATHESVVHASPSLHSASVRQQPGSLPPVGHDVVDPEHSTCRSHASVDA